MEQQVNWNNTFLDSEVWMTALDKTHVKRVVLYFVSIVLYIIGFVYLFEYKMSEYIAYVVVFIVNSIFPFIWLPDFREYIKRNYGNTRDIFSDFNVKSAKTLTLYRELGMYGAMIMQFLALFLVLIKNENVRKMKKYNEENSDGEKSQKKGLDTTHKLTEHRDKVILILFVTISTIIWSLVGYTFAETDVMGKGEFTTPLIDSIRWMLNQPYAFIRNFDNTWHYYMNKVTLPPLVKAFSMYCVVFISVFFGAFIRIPNFKKPRSHHPMDRFNIINMGSTFPQEFERNIEDYRSLSVFFLCSIISIGLGGLMYLLKWLVKVPKLAVQIVTTLGVILTFASLFGERYKLFPDSKSVKKLVFFLMCILFAILGTPVVLAFFQLCAEMGVFATIQKIFAYLFCVRSGGTNCTYTPMYTLNNGWLGTLAGLIGTALLFMMYGLGVDKNWVDNLSRKPMLMFNVILICMAVSLGMALMTHYKLGLAVYEVVKNIIQMILLYLAPLAILVLSIVQFQFSYQNYEKYKKFEKMKV